MSDIYQTVKDLRVIIDLYPNITLTEVGIKRDNAKKIVRLGLNPIF